MFAHVSPQEDWELWREGPGVSVTVFLGQLWCLLIGDAQQLLVK